MADDEIYGRGSRASFFLDLAAAAGAAVRHVSQEDAKERLLVHEKRSRVGAELESRAALRALDSRGITAHDATGGQVRALSATPGMGVEFTPPEWILSRWASVTRAAAPLKGLVTKVPLPPSTLELRVPRFDTAAGVVPEQFENVDPPEALSETDEVVSKVATFAGDVLLSQQIFDRGGQFADEIILKDFAENYGEALQGQLMNGTGKNGQLLGLLNVPTTAVGAVPGARFVTYTTASPTPALMTEYAAKCGAQISDVRKRAPSAMFMRGARWFWTVGSPDGSGNESTERPGTGVLPADPDTGPYGPLASLPVYHDNTLPTDLGTEANQDPLVLARTRDILLLEDPLGPRFSAQPGTNAAGQMTVLLQWHAYTAAYTNLYPSAIGTVQGTGLAVPAGF